MEEGGAEETTPNLERSRSCSDISPTQVVSGIALRRSETDPQFYHDRQFHVEKASLRELFDEFDIDKNATMDLRDLQKALEKHNLPCSMEQAKVWMQAIDDDHNGKLDFKEFTFFMRYAWDLMSKMQVPEQAAPDQDDVMFLGGSCNPTTWRRDVSMPLLEKNGVKYYNPQVDDWSPDLMVLEQKAKNVAKVLLFVVDGLTRAVASMVEIAELITLGRKIVLVVNNIEDGQEIDGAPVGGRELQDLNRGRAYLANLADRHEVPVYTDVIHATFHAIKIMQDKELETHMMFRKRSDLKQS